MTDSPEALETLDKYLQSPEVETALDARTILALTLFKDMSPIASPTGHEEPMAEYLQNFAREHNFETMKDEIGNVAIWVPATSGYENAPGLCLQGHQDGVPKADEGKPNPAQFGVKPILREINHELWLAADGTTLWADNRAGVAASLALAVDPAAVHPKMLFLFTVGEEKDMRGVANFGIPIDTKEYPVLWNLDSEDEGVIVKGSACAAYTDFAVPIERTPVSGQTLLQLHVSGTLGERHSGLGIHKGRINANKVLAGLITQTMSEGVDLRLVDLSDDNYDISTGELVTTKNSICRIAQATLAVAPEDREQVESIIEKLKAQAKETNRTNDPDLEITLTQAPTQTDGQVFAMTSDSTHLIIGMINNLPHGVIKAVEGHPDQVLTSTNLAIAKIDKDELAVTFAMMSRAANEDDVEIVREQIASIVKDTALNLAQSDILKGWTANENYDMTEFLNQVYLQLFKVLPDQQVYHAGLETGELQSLFPDMDIKSFGMTIHGPHGTTECMSIPSYDRFIPFLFAAAGAYAEGGIIDKN